MTAEELARAFATSAGEAAEPEVRSDGVERTRQRPARLDKRLRRQAVSPQATLDLHGLDRRQAARSLRTFLRIQVAQNVEIVLIVHGKGRGLLAEAVGEILDRHPHVAEHLPAPTRLGGGGARVVRLRDR